MQRLQSWQHLLCYRHNLGWPYVLDLLLTRRSRSWQLSSLLSGAPVNTDSVCFTVCQYQMHVDSSECLLYLYLRFTKLVLFSASCHIVSTSVAAVLATSILVTTSVHIPVPSDIHTYIHATFSMC